MHLSIYIYIYYLSVCVCVLLATYEMNHNYLNELTILMEAQEVKFKKKKKVINRFCINCYLDIPVHQVLVLNPSSAAWPFFWKTQTAREKEKTILYIMLKFTTYELETGWYIAPYREWLWWMRWSTVLQQLLQWPLLEGLVPHRLPPEYSPSHAHTKISSY